MTTKTQYQYREQSKRDRLAERRQARRDKLAERAYAARAYTRTLTDNHNR